MCVNKSGNKLSARCERYATDAHYTAWCPIVCHTLACLFHVFNGVEENLRMFRSHSIYGTEASYRRHSPVTRFFNLFKFALYSAWNVPPRKIQINKNMQIFRSSVLPFTCVLFQKQCFCVYARVRTRNTETNLWKENEKDCEIAFIRTPLSVHATEEEVNLHIFFSLFLFSRA